jgi:large subunit ribosomal protein L4
MLEVPVYNTAGEQVETMSVDEALFGGEVNVSLVKQAIVAYHANRRQGSAANLSRGQVSGTNKKPYAQKHTGHARRGDMKTNLLRGGGVTFAKAPRSFRKCLPRQMRRRALQSAILAKLLGQDLAVVDGLKFEEPKTKPLVSLLRNLKINRSCLLTIAGADHNAYLSGRNIPNLAVCTTADLNAFDVATRRKMLVTRDAMAALMNRETQP